MLRKSYVADFLPIPSCKGRSIQGRKPQTRGRQTARGQGAVLRATPDSLAAKAESLRKRFSPARPLLSLSNLALRAATRLPHMRRISMARLGMLHFQE